MPDAGFPEMMHTEAELEAAYRFFDNERVSPEAILSPHYAETAEKAAAAKEVLVAHDSSWFVFSGEDEREGLGRVGRGKRKEGFLGHFALCLSADEHCVPLGLLGLSSHTFRGEPKKQTQKECLADPERKSLRWGAMVRVVDERLEGRARAIHLMDREADDYALFEELSDAEERFVVRLRHDRTVKLEDGMAQRLRQAMTQVPTVIEREVVLSPRSALRPPPQRKLHPPRERRTARLALRAATIELPRPEYRKHDCKSPSVTLNAVQVLELDAPQGETPVEWLLLTSEPIGTAEQVEAVVDAYRARWVIEEYFKALKTGCAYEERQLETLPRLENALAFLAPVAVELLRLRNIARLEPDAPATRVLTNTQLAVLLAIARTPMPDQPTVRDALFAIAALGGHLRRNGWPGWLVLFRGYVTLRTATIGWLAARRARM